MTKEQILYEDDDIIVCHKPAGIATQTAKVGQRDMVSEVTNYLAAHDQGKPYVGIINRLDQPVEGILVFGKNQKAANALSRQIVENRMEKYYYAVVSGKGLSVNVEPEGIRRETLTDHMLKDNRSNMSRIVSPEVKGAKKAVLKYEVLERKESIALVRIKLITGRHHQIRVQMSHAGMSLLGDHKYADEQTKKLSDELQQKQAALCAYRLEFTHPLTGKRLSFQRKPEGSIFQNFSI
ncbi:MAG: RluA family pseudouridine synthase [Lachnospiraceae bacterium]|nr:RluA family pseudouridine synthase [Lachnospiraceae bacterium]